MHSPDSTMEDIAVKAEPSEPSNSTELDDPRGPWGEVSYDIPLKADPDHPSSQYESSRLIGEDLPSSTLARNNAEVKPWLGDESKDAPTSGNTKDVSSPKMYTNHSGDSLCGEVGAIPTPLHSAKSLPFRSASKRKFHECTGLSYQIDPIVPQYEVDPYGSGEVIMNDPLKPDPDDTSAEHGPRDLNETDPTRSNAQLDYDEVKKEEFHNDPCMASMVTNDSSDLKYDDVAENTTKVFACEDTLSKELIISGIVGARTDVQMIGKSPPSTSAPRRKSFEPLPPVMGASAKSVRIKKAPGEKPFACDVCDYRAAKASHLKSHVATHTGEKPYGCDVCDYRAGKASHLKRHIATHTGEKPYGCVVCDYRAARASHLTRHMAIHTGEKPYGCDVCDYRAARASHLKTHMATHTGEKPYSCDVCDYRAAQASHLKTHMTTHTGDKPYACEVCDYRAALASHLRSHMATHTGENPYACEMCDYRASLASHLKSHMATHTGEKPFACDVCDYRAAVVSHLKSHMTTHTDEKPYCCDVCDYRAARASQLKIHMATHTGEKPHACDVCDYRAAQAPNLKRHMATHTGEKPYGCDMCDYRAARASHLNRHMTIHTGEKPYGCDVCDYRAARATYLKRHMATHTGMEASDGCSWVRQSSDAGMMSSDAEGTAKADELMAGPSHHVDPIVAHHDEDPFKVSANFSLNCPLKLDPDDPSADYGSSSSMKTDLHRSVPLLGHDEVKTELLCEADAGLCDPLEVCAHQQPCEPPLHLQLTVPPHDGDPHQLSAEVRSCDIIKMEQYD